MLLNTDREGTGSRASASAASSGSERAKAVAVLLLVLLCILLAALAPLRGCVGDIGTAPPELNQQFAGRPGPHAVAEVGGNHRTVVPVDRVPPDPTSAIGGVVLDSRDGPLSSVAVGLEHMGGIVTAPPRITSDSGEFRWCDLPIGVYRVRARWRGEVVESVVAAPDESIVLRFSRSQRDQSTALRVRVLDEFAGVVANAQVRVNGDLGCVVGLSGAGGECSFEGPPCSEAAIVATASDGRVGYGRHYRGAPAEDPLLTQVVVGPAGQLHGRLVPLNGAQIGVSLSVVARVGAPATPFDRGHAVDFETEVNGGEYRFEGLPAGKYSLDVTGLAASGLHLCSVDSDGNSLVEPTDGWIFPVMAEVRGGTATRCDLHVSAGGAVSGAVRSETGAPLTGVIVHCERLLRAGRAINEGLVFGAPVEISVATPAMVPDSMSGRFVHEVTTDPDGRYQIDGLTPGPYRLVVGGRNRTRLIDSGVIVTAGQRCDQDFILAPAGAIEGVVGHRVVVVVWQIGGNWCRARATDNRGLFSIDGVPPGRHKVAVIEHRQLAAAQLTMPDPPHPIMEVDVEAGRSAFVDLGIHLPVCIRGRLSGADGPWRSTELRLLGRSARTDDEGWFEFRFASPLISREYVEVCWGGISTNVWLPVETRGARRWSGRLELLTETTTFSTMTSDGLPVAAYLRLSGAANGELRTSADSGSVEIPLPLGLSDIEAVFDNSARVERRVRAGDKVKLMARPVTTVRVIVKDGRNRPLECIKVNVAVWVGAEAPSPSWSSKTAQAADVMGMSAVTDAAGQAVLRGVPPGSAIVTVVPSVGRTARLSEPKRLLLEAGLPVEVILSVDI